MICPRCQFDCPAEFGFCPKCGTPLQQACPRCGFQMPAEFAFCPKCGSPLAPGAAAGQGTPDMLSRVIQRHIPKEYAERLLATCGQPHDERRTVTILFSDIKGSTAMLEKLDPEEAKEVIQGAFEFLIAPIFRCEGTLVQLMGDAILAFFGAPIAHEDDPERACRAGLEITAKAAKYAKEIQERKGIEGFDVRVGINTGLVVVGEVGSDLRVAYTAIGDAINMAARIEENAPVGGVLITHDTYRHVRGVFDVEPQPPLVVKGRVQPVQTYLVQRAKPRAFRLETRGVEGVETRTIGREAELQTLQNAYFDATESCETRVAVVSGDAGVGKSRLLYEFLSWAELRPERFWLFKGRARAETQAVPYSVLRDLFANRFEILESDSAATALHKFRAGMAGFLEPDRADLVGHWAGFDFSSSQAVSNLAASSSFAQLASAYLLNYLRALVADRPMVMVLEDMHWVDGSSLDLIDHIVTRMPKDRLLVLCLARPTLFERRPNWGQGREAYKHLVLSPLSRRQSRALVVEILQKVETIPDDLCNLIVDGAEGNPFYIEELIKMLIEEGVIVRPLVPPSNGGAEEQWSVQMPRLLGLHVPSTLTGVVQARLDSLPPEAREVLQRAAVVGRVFWDGAVAALGVTETQAPGAAGVEASLETARQRELIFRREHSSFVGTQEYIFKHPILHNVTYETVLLKLRRVHHEQVAQWLEANAGERVGEYAGLIAEHYERASRGALAAHWLGRMAEAAHGRGASREASVAAEKALALLPEEDKVARAELLRRLGRSLRDLGNYVLAREKLNAALALAHEAGDDKTAALTLCSLAALAWQQGASDQIQGVATEALALARSAGDQLAEAEALLHLGIAAADPSLSASLFEQSLALSRKIGDRAGVSICLNNLGEVSRSERDYARARRYFEESLARDTASGDRAGLSFALFNLGEVAAAQKDPAAARRYQQEALAICQQLGRRLIAAFCLGALGHSAAATGDWSDAQHYLGQALSEAVVLGARSLMLYALVGFASLKAQMGEPVRATEWLGLALRHPAGTAETDVQQRAESLLADLCAALPATQLDAALARGAELELDVVVAEIQTSPVFDR